MALGHNMNLMVQQQQQQHHNQIKHTPIAPAPISKNGFCSSPSVLGMNGVNVQSNGNNAQFKKKYTYTNMPYGEQPASVVRRNARERNRVKQVNNGFVTLRQHIPQTIVTSVTNGGRGASKKLSKVDTLRMAVEYIRRLQDLIEEADSDAASTSTYSSQGSTAGSPPPSFYHQNNEPFAMPASYSATSSSPAPSFSSENSIGSGNNYSHSHETSSIQQPQYKFEPFEGYNNFQTTSDDEELLDYISFWQEQ